MHNCTVSIWFSLKRKIQIFVIHTLSHKVSSSLCFPIPAFASEFLQTRCRTSRVCCRKRLQPQQLNHFVVCSSFLPFRTAFDNFWSWVLHLNFPSSSLVNFELFFSSLMIAYIREGINHHIQQELSIYLVLWWENVEIWAMPCCFEIHAKYLNSATPHQVFWTSDEVFGCHMRTTTVLWRQR